MKRTGAAIGNWAAKGLAIALVLGLGAATAWAGPAHSGVRSGSASHGRGGGANIGSALRNAKRDTPVIDGLRSAARHNGYKGDHPVLDAIRDNYGRGDYYNGYNGGHHNGHHNDDDYARAYRDVGIANAIVDLVGVATTAAYGPRYYAPAPIAVGEPYPAPSCGYYRIERVLVCPGHHEDYRVWVPETRDHCGRVYGGYYEVQQRWIPDRYEERQVWVER